jgi:type I restriction enzyme, S subunit
MSSLEDYVLPMDWKLAQISEVTVRTGQRNPGKQPEKTFRYIDVSGVDNTLFKVREAITLKGSSAPSRARKDIRRDDVIFATVRPMLKRVAMIPPELDGEIASTGYCVLRANREKIAPGFLYDCLLTDWFIDAMGKLERGASYPAVRDSDVFNAEIPLPPLPEQGKIAAVLGVVQRAIEEQERLLALTAELKKTLLHKLFTEGLRGEPQKQTEIGPVPDSWEVVKLGDLFQIKHGFAFDGKFFKPAGRYILLTPGHFFESGGFRDQGQKTKFYTGEFPRGYLLQKGELLVVMTEQKEGLLGSSVIVPESDRYLHNQRLGLIQDLDQARLSKDFLYYLFSTPAVRKRIFMTASGSKVRHTSPDKIRDVWVALPSLEEQHESVKALAAVDQKLAVTARKHAALTALFRTLLHQLMTAQIRVHDLDLSGLETALKE